MNIFFEKIYYINLDRRPDRKHHITKILEKNNIGRPSTWAAILPKILEKNYIEVQKNSLHMNDTGLLVSKELENFFEFIIL